MIDTSLQIAMGGASMAASITLANDHMPGIPMLRRLVVSGVGAWGLAIFLRAVLQFVPVVADMQATEVWRTTDQVVLAITGNNQRESCKFIGSEAYSVSVDGRHKAVANFLQDRSSASENTIGRQSFGDWIIKFDDGTRPYEVMIILHHDCGRMLGLTRTEAGPYRISTP